MVISGIAARVAAAALSAGLATGAVAVGVNVANSNDGQSTRSAASAPGRADASVSTDGQGTSVTGSGSPQGADGVEGSANAQGSSAAVLNSVGGVLRLPSGTIIGTPSSADARKALDRASDAPGVEPSIPNLAPGNVSDQTLPGTPPGATPTVPTVPDVNIDTSPFAEGSYTLLVPGTPAVSKRLCLSGSVTDSCVTVSVGALQPTTITVAYSARTGGELPTYSVASCSGGLVLTIGALTPGTSVTVSANDKSVTRQLGGNEYSETASLCDA